MDNEKKQTYLKSYQAYLFRMLLEFDAYCEKNNIEYFLAGGSALGAVRHAGFIPWDDDIDLAMLRPDFERMEQLLARNGNRIGPYVYSPVLGQIVKDAPIGHLLFLPEGDYDAADAPKLDIHPIDGLPKVAWKRKIQRFFSIVHYMAVYRLPTKNKGKAAHIISKLLVKITPDKLFDFYAKISLKIISAHSAETAEEVCSLFGLAGYANEVMKRKMLVPYQKIKFEDVLLPVPNQLEDYLTKLYGDYMTLPAEDERAPKHQGYVHFMDAIEH